MDIRTLWKMFLYGGIEREEYKALRPNIREENRLLLRVFSLIASIMFFMLFIVSLISGGFSTVNTSTYLVCCVVMAAIMLCVRFLVPKKSALVMVLVYVFELTLYAFGIHISMLHADKPAVSAVTFLLVSPLLFYDRPFRLTGLIAAVAAVFCGIVASVKAPEVAENDIWNAVTFGIVAIVTTLFMASIKIRSIAQSKQIQQMSQTDLLTGVKNRNHYENRLSAYPGMCASNLICVYADVNGLHEMNNRYGHIAGDKMLREVAEALRQCFGSEHTYRIGGDEFVAFRVDGQPKVLPLEIELLRKGLDDKGYHVSFGTAVRQKEQGGLNMQELVNEAEGSMFADKRQFYSLSGNNRRSR